MKNLLIICLILISATLFAQESLKGKVIDAETKEPMAFVNLTYNDNKEGCITDLDGLFTIPDKKKASFIQCSFVGYKTEKIPLNGNENFMIIEMHPEALTLNEVTVLPGENPAHRIVYKAIENKAKHNPDNLDSYELTSYSKMFFTVDSKAFQNSAKKDSAGNSKDTSNVARMMDFLEKNHLFLMESATKKQFQSPDKTKEEILASRVSGLKHPSFTYLAAEYQSFSFYDEIIEVAGQEYISPLCKNSPNKYFFLLKDTAYTETGDTTFIMSFQPKRGTNFSGLEGLIYINSDGWAIQNVIAEPKTQSSEMRVKIQQQYNKPDGLHWFPMQLNTDFIVDFIELSDSAGSGNSKLLGVGKTYIKNVSINTEIENRLKSGTEIVYAKDATEKDEHFWDNFRIQQLDTREKNTYELIDSVGDAVNLDQKLASIEILATGKIPWGVINIDLNRLYWFNEYEGSRLGLGIETNKRLSNYFSFFGYGAYGIRDEAFKYGGGINITPLKNERLILQAAYTHDIRESNAYNFSSNQFESESFREFFLSDFDWYSTWTANIQAQIFRGFHSKAYLDFNKINYTNRDDQIFPRFYGEMTGWESGIETKWVIHENIIRTPKGNIMSMGSKYPDIHFNIRKGIPWKDDTFKPYWRFETRFHDVLETKWIGDLHITADAGLIYSDFPIYGQGFSLHKSGKWLDSDNSFATMSANGIFADRFVALFLKYDIGSLLFHVKNWKPEFALVSNMFIGENRKFPYYEMNSPIQFAYPDKIYMESGLQINALLKQLFIKYGVGFYYNHGDYARDDFKDNFAIKLRIEYEF